MWPLWSRGWPDSRLPALSTAAPLLFACCRLVGHWQGFMPALHSPNPIAVHLHGRVVGTSAGAQQSAFCTSAGMQS